MTSQQPEQGSVQDSSRVLDEHAIIVLDRLAVDGGHITRETLFDRCQVSFWGRPVNVAARRSGYEGHDAVEVERRGKQQLFIDTINHLLELGVIVVWDEAGNELALHPTHRVPIHTDGPAYVPGTEYWNTQRNNALTELRTELIRVRDQSLDVLIKKVADLYAQQIRRGQLADEGRAQALSDLLRLADTLFDPTRLAKLLGVPETELRTAAAPTEKSPIAITTPKRARRSTVKLVSDIAPSTQDSLVADNEAVLKHEAISAPPRQYRKLRSNTIVTIDQLAAYLRPRGPVMRSQLQGVFDLDAQSMSDLLDEFGQRYPGTVVFGTGSNGKPRTIVHPPSA